nr:all-trans retinoic acid-induced differentiation factor-like [Pocillopora verrucosa]
MSLNLRRFFSGCLLFYFLFIINTSFGSFQGQWSHDSKKFEICKLRSCFDGGHNVTASCKVNETTIWRCCVSNGTGIIGLDLTNCSLKTLPSLQSVNMSLNWLYLQNNPALECNSSAFHGHFKGFANLTKLILPRRCNCTGGDSVWKQHIINGSVRQCYGQRNSCKVLNVTCPGNSACSSNGPGFSQCLCKPGWHGYKCLVKSGFPWLLIFAPVGGSTVVLIVVILLIQRRRRGQRPTRYSVLH